MLYNKPFADRVVRMNPDDLKVLYDSCFASVKDRIDRCIHMTGMDSERQRLVTDILYLSVVGKTLAAKSGDSIDLYDFADSDTDNGGFVLVSYVSEETDISFLDASAEACSQFLAEYEPIRVEEDLPAMWK